MSEFKYACPVCGQHMSCDESQSGTVMECPTCFQKITAPQAPTTDDPKFILTGTKVGERPLPSAVTNAEPLPQPEEEGKPIRLAWVFFAVFCVAAAVLFLFHGKIFKSTAGPANPGSTASNEVAKPVPPKPIVGPAIVVFGKGEKLIVGEEKAGAEVKDPAKAAFLTAFKADLAAPSVYAGPLPLTTHSGVGREVPTATGDIRYHESFPGGLVIGVTLGGLVPNHEYVLTINGAIQHDGNNNLPDQFPRNNPQKFFDFSPVTTDASGSYQATFGVRLPPGPYDVYFFVKDTADWNIVLGHDLFQFRVE
jgi:DNA-directed RNA polymerase subunit RPC12/RpoP